MPETVDELKLIELIYKDELTGLYNRRYYGKTIADYLKQAHQRNEPLSLALIDVDSFKKINDNYGHLTGDSVLAKLGELLRQFVSSNDLPIRYAGDEFLIIFTNTRKEDAGDFLTKLLESARKELKKVIREPVKFEITLSIGVAGFPINALDAKKLFQRGDEALYEAKRKGKGQIVVYPDKGRLVAVTNFKTIFPEIKLIGREKIISQIEKAMFADESSLTRFPIIYAELGMGKTKVIQELMNNFQKLEYWVLLVKGNADWGNKPYKSILGGIENLLARNRELLNEIGSKLSRMQKQLIEKDIPILKELNDNDLEEVREEPKVAYFNAINKFLVFLINAGGLVITMDDIQWIDNASLELLDTLYQEFKNAKLWYCGTLNKTDQGMEHDWNNIIRFFTNINKLKKITEIEMGPLDTKNTAMLVQEIFPKIKSPDQFYDDLYSKTKGSPLFIEETLSNLIEKEVIQFVNGNWIVPTFKHEDIYNSVEDTLTQRLKGISEETMEILKKAVIIGNEFDIKFLEQLMDMSEAQILESLEEARNAQIIDDVPNNPGKFVFMHTLTRNLLYDGVDLNERQKLHKDIAEIGKQLYSDNLDNIIGRLAYHYSRAGMWDKASEASQELDKIYLDAYIPKAILTDLQRRIRTNAIAKENPLSDSDLRRALQASRLLKIALQNVRFYPKDNANVINAIEHFYQELSYFFEHTEAFTLSVVEDVILINGQEPSSDDMRIAPFEELKELYLAFGLEGLVFLRGLVKQELVSFLDLLIQDPEEVRKNWPVFLENYHIEHIMPDRK
ncbi:diguanylate cyclase, partial [bacterium]|nr:diguanylate cyclase [bacterium]